MRYTSGTENIIKHIQEIKNVGRHKLCARLGIRPEGYSKMMKHIGLTRLIKICDALGVELCIIDGWRKYRLNNFSSLPEIEILFNEMNRTYENRDLYLEKKGEDEKTREYFAKERQKVYCRGCRWCVPELAKDGVYWCKKHEDYVMKEGCRDERDIQKVFSE